MEAERAPTQSRIRFDTAAAVFEALPALRGDVTCEPRREEPLGFMAALLAGPTPEEAVTFCAYLLGRRDAVWWGCRCLRQAAAQLPTGDVEFMKLAEDWAVEPEEELRRRALAAGYGAASKTPGAWLALAAGWTGGSMVADGTVAVAPPPHLTAKALNVAILAALARLGGGEERAKALAAFVGLGRGVAEGRDVPARQAPATYTAPGG